MNFDNNMQLISQTIKQKERELQEIHDLRCNELEKMIIERDQLLIDASKRFEKIKEDFQYNLTLIEARDVEIERLEKLVDEKEEQVNQLDADLRAAVLKYELLEKKYEETNERYSSEKAKSKEVVNELREVVESMQWASAEESKSKLKEIESLKADIKRLTLNREESLELQRKDITSAFELLLHQREEAFSTKESEINEQIMLLGARLEQISTDNSALKSQLSSANRKVDELTIEKTNLDDTIRKLQWKLEDERAAKQESDEVLHRNLQQTAFELSNLRVALNTESQENKFAMAKMEQKLSDETAKRLEIQNNHDHLKNHWLVEKSELESKIASLSNSLEKKEEDVLTLRDQYRKMTESYQSLKDRYHQSESALSQYRQENQQLQNHVAALQDKEHDMADQVAAMKLSHVQTLQSVESSHIRERKLLENQFNTQLHDLKAELELKQMEYNIKSTSTEDELLTTKRALDEKTKALDDERADASALRLRLQLLENQMLSLKQRRERESREELTSSSSSAFGLLQSDQHPRSSYPPMHHAAHSPAFSEDMGPASLSKLSVPHYDNEQGISLDDLLIHGEAGQRLDDKLVEENEALKRIIKEMRSDMEQFQASASYRSPVKDRLDSDRSDILEKRLQQMTDEVNRLRQERRKLLDNSNELRAALTMRSAMTYESNQKTHEHAAVDAAPIEPSKPFVSASGRPSSAPDILSPTSTLAIEGTSAGRFGLEKAAARNPIGYRRPPTTAVPQPSQPTANQAKPQNPTSIRKVPNYNALREQHTS